MDVITQQWGTGTPLLPGGQSEKYAAPQWGYFRARTSCEFYLDSSLKWKLYRAGTLFYTTSHYDLDYNTYIHKRACAQAHTHTHT